MSLWPWTKVGRGGPRTGGRGQHHQAGYLPLRKLVEGLYQSAASLRPLLSTYPHIQGLEGAPREPLGAADVEVDASLSLSLPGMVTSPPLSLSPGHKMKTSQPCESM